MIRPPTLIASIGLVAAGLTAAPQGKRGRSPADFFPDHTYVYAQIQPFSGVSGAKSLKLANLLQDETIADLVDAMVNEIPADADPRQMLERYPLHRCVGDGLGIGLVGFEVQTNDKPARHLSFPQDGPPNRDLMNKLRRLQSRVLISVAVTDRHVFLDTVSKILRNEVYDGDEPKCTTHDVHGLEVRSWQLPGEGPGTKLHSSFAHGHCVFAQYQDDLVTAVKRCGARSAALSTRGDFRRFAAHRKNKPTAAFLHVGLDSIFDLVRPMIPRKDRESMELWGAFDYSGAQLGVGFHEGGLCEWLHVAFAENPRGVFMNLGRLWPSWDMVETQTDRGSVYAASLTFDWAAFYNTTMLVLDMFDVDTTQLRDELAHEIGVDVDDLMSAVGNTLGIIAVLPRVGFIPELSFVVKVRNRAKMERILGGIVDEAAREGVKTKRFTVPGGGPKGTYLTFDKEVPVKPAFAFSGDKLVISTMPLTLKSAIAKSRKTGLATVDHLPDPTGPGQRPTLRWSTDLGPMAANLYADLLKVADSSERRLPFDVSDLPPPQFISDSLASVGFRFAIDPYFMSLDLESPVGIAIPTVAGLAIWAEQQQAAERARRRERARRASQSSSAR